MTPRYSLVVPIYNEADNLPALLRRAASVLGKLSGTYEIILVDDGSTDATPSVIAAASERYPQLRPLRHESNRGQSVALLDGLRAARGEFILTMDGDGQNDPQDFPLLLAPVESGQLDLACGWRTDRHDSSIRNSCRRLAIASGAWFWAIRCMTAGASCEPCAGR